MEEHCPQIRDDHRDDDNDGDTDYYDYNDDGDDHHDYNADDDDDDHHMIMVAKMGCEDEPGEENRRPGKNCPRGSV